MGGKPHQMLVHIDGKRPYCVMVETQIVNSQLINIATTALQRYNSIHCTTYDISQISVFLIDENDTVEIPVDKFDQNPENYEMVLRLPDFEPLQHKITIDPDDEIKYIETANELKEKGDYLSAITMSTYSPGNYSSLSTEYKTLIYSNLKSCETRNFRLLAPPKLQFTQLLRKCEENYDNLMLFRMYCQELAKDSPLLVIKIIFNYPETLKLLPEFTQKIEDFEYALNEIKQISVTPACLKYISDIYFNYGMIEYSSRIYRSIDIITNSSDEEFRAYCWKLFLLHDMPKLHQALISFFRINRNISIGVLTFDRVYQLLCDLYNGTSTFDSSMNIHYQTISYESRPHLCHICYIAGLCLFYCGMYDQFFLIFQCDTGITFSELNRLKPSAREWKIGKSILINQGWGCEKLPKDRMNCVLAEYQAFKDNFASYSIVRPHDTYLLSHVSFYEIAAPEPCFGKRCFWNLVETASQYHTLTIMNGRYDYKTILPHLIQNRVFSSVRSALDVIANSVSTVFAQVHEKYPNLKLVFVELAGYVDEAQIADQLNSCIRAVLPEYVQFLEQSADYENAGDPSDYYGKCFMSTFV